MHARTGIDLIITTAIDSLIELKVQGRQHSREVIARNDEPGHNLAVFWLHARTKRIK